MREYLKLIGATGLVWSGRAYGEMLQKGLAGRDLLQANETETQNANSSDCPTILVPNCSLSEQVDWTFRDNNTVKCVNELAQSLPLHWDLPPSEVEDLFSEEGDFRINNTKYDRLSINPVTGALKGMLLSVGKYTVDVSVTYASCKPETFPVHFTVCNKPSLFDDDEINRSILAGQEFSFFSGISAKESSHPLKWSVQHGPASYNLNLCMEG